MKNKSYQFANGKRKMKYLIKFAKTNKDKIL